MISSKKEGEEELFLLLLFVFECYFCFVLHTCMHTSLVQVLHMFPQLEGHVQYFDVGSPLSNVFYLGTTKGEVYGVDHNTTRFSMEAMTRMRPDVGIPGLFLTGQDVLACGFSGALYGGLFCAMSIVKRNLIEDLAKLSKQAKKELRAKKAENELRAKNE